MTKVCSILNQVKCISEYIQYLGLSGLENTFNIMLLFLSGPHFLNRIECFLLRSHLLDTVNGLNPGVTIDRVV